jgi:hypothetical protein
MLRSEVQSTATTSPPDMRNFIIADASNDPVIQSKISRFRKVKAHEKKKKLFSVFKRSQFLLFRRSETVIFHCFTAPDTFHASCHPRLVKFKHFDCIQSDFSE